MVPKGAPVAGVSPVIDLTDEHDGNGGRRSVTQPTQARPHVPLPDYEQDLPHALGADNANDDNFFNAAFPDMDWDALIMENEYHQRPPQPITTVAGPAQAGQWFDFDGEQVFVPDENASPPPVARWVDKVDVAMHDADEPAGIRFTADMCVEHVTAIFPDIDPEYVRQLWSDGGAALEGGPQALCFRQCEIVLDKLLADGTYPKRSKGKQVERKRKREGTPEGDDEEFARRIAVYSQPDRSFTPGTLRIIGNMLKAEFPHLTRHFIAIHMLPPQNLWKTYINISKALDTPVDSGTQPVGRGRPVKHPELASAEVIAANSQHPELGLEFQTVRRYVAEQRAKKSVEEARRLAEEDNLRAAIAAGETAECQACFESLPMNRQIHCSGETTHFTCFECADNYVRAEVSEARCRVLCTAGCGAGFAPDQLGQLSDKQALARLAQLQQDKDIRDAGLDDLEECPFCDYKAILPPIEEDFEFRCANPECARVSCRRCKAVSHVPISCEEHAREHRQSARHVVEEAMTAALKRTCNNCKKSYIKDYGCNKMKCPSCGTLQCYVCSQTVADYKHFDQPYPERVGGAGPVQEVRCPLYDDVEARHEREVKEAADAARAQVLAEDPNVQPDDLKIDMPADSAAATEARRRARDVMAPFAMPFNGALPAHHVLDIEYLDVAAVPDFVWQRFVNTGDVNLLPEVLRQFPRAELHRLRRIYEQARRPDGPFGHPAQRRVAIDPEEARAMARAVQPGPQGEGLMARIQAEILAQMQAHADAAQGPEMLERQRLLRQAYEQAEQARQQLMPQAAARAPEVPLPEVQRVRRRRHTADAPVLPRREAANHPVKTNRLAQAAAGPADAAPAPERPSDGTAGTRARRAAKKTKRQPDSNEEDDLESSGEWTDTDDSDNGPSASDTTLPASNTKGAAESIRRTVANVGAHMNRRFEGGPGLNARERAGRQHYRDEFDHRQELREARQHRAQRLRNVTLPAREAANIDPAPAPRGVAKVHEESKNVAGPRQRPVAAATTLDIPNDRAPVVGEAAPPAAQQRAPHNNDHRIHAFLEAPPAYEPLAAQAQLPGPQAPAAQPLRADRNWEAGLIPAQTRDHLERGMQEHKQRLRQEYARLGLLEPDEDELPPQYPQDGINMIGQMAAMVRNVGDFYQPYQPYAFQVDGAAAGPGDIPAANHAYAAAMGGAMFYQPIAAFGVNGDAYEPRPHQHWEYPPNPYYGAWGGANVEQHAPADVHATAQNEGQERVRPAWEPPRLRPVAQQAQPDPDPTQELERQMAEDDLANAGARGRMQPPRPGEPYAGANAGANADPDPGLERRHREGEEFARMLAEDFRLANEAAAAGHRPWMDLLRRWNAQNAPPAQRDQARPAAAGQIVHGSHCLRRARVAPNNARPLQRNAAPHPAAREQGARNNGQNNNGGFNQPAVLRGAYVAYQRGYARMRDHAEELAARERERNEREPLERREAHDRDAARLEGMYLDAMRHVWQPQGQQAGPENVAAAAVREQMDWLDAVHDAGWEHHQQILQQVQPQLDAQQQQQQAYVPHVQTQTRPQATAAEPQPGQDTATPLPAGTADNNPANNNLAAAAGNAATARNTTTTTTNDNNANDAPPARAHQSRAAQVRQQLLVMQQRQAARDRLQAQLRQQRQRPH